MLVVCDASQLEWRTVVELSQDPVGLKEIEDGLDFHSINQETFGLPDRLTSKIYLFRTIFNWGKGYAFTVDPKFMHVSTSVKFWDDVGKKFYEKYNGIDKLYHKNLEIITKKQPIIGPLGREWLISPFDKDGNFNLPYTKAVNYPTQGTGADVMMLARISFWNKLKKIPDLFHNVKLISTVHDSINTDVNHKEVDIKDVARLFNDVFKDLPKNIEKIFGYKWKTPLACETKAGMDMKNMLKLKV